jgi:hypothetical protein
MNMEEELQLFKFFKDKFKLQYNSFQKKDPDNTITNVDQRKKKTMKILFPRLKQKLQI